MKLNELAQACAKEINLQKKYGIENARPHVILKMKPSGRESKNRRLVAEGHCPIGQVIAKETDADVVAFDAVDVLAWCTVQSNGIEKVTWPKAPEGGAS